MDNHPIPQDITGFQFKLIGNMTIKQFIYLAIGGVFAWIFFFVLPLPGFLKWILSIISISIGAMFALVPIDGRPMDLMVANFIKALISPTQFVYEKKGGNLDEHKPYKAPESDLPRLPVNNIPPVYFQNTPQEPVMQDIQPLPQIVIPTPPPPPAPIPVSASSPYSPTITMDQNENKKLKEELENLKKELESLKSTPPPPPPPQIVMPISQILPTTDLEKNLTQTQREKDELQKQLLELRAKMENSAQTFTPATIQAPLKQTQRVRQVPQGMEKSVGLPSAPEDPNLITGIIKDARGNPISNILVEIKDSDSNPVRAFKTNPLGKFASATALSNGKYILNFEDSAEKHKFDAVEIELIGAPVMPLEIISVDPREELRRELFN